MIAFIWGVILITCGTLYIRRIYARFSSHGVKHIMPMPLFGSMARVTFRNEHWAECIQRSYDTFPGERFIGHFEFFSPILIVKDIELIKKVTIKDFEHFVDHRVLIDTRHDELFGRHLFSLKGQEWKDMRSTLSPAFTSSKIRLMVPFMREVGEQMMTNFKKRLQDSKSDHIDIDVKSLTTRYATDVIASCAFGLKVDSHNDEQNEFYVMGKETANFGFLQVLKFFIISSMPFIINLIKVPLFSQECKDFFRNIVINTMKEREVNNTIRPDMIHLLMEAKKGQLTHDGERDTGAGFATVEESSIGKINNTIAWSDDDLVAQAILFFIAGFETVSTAMSFLIYELALNPDIQERLFKEINEHNFYSKGVLDYDAIQNLSYLDMVVSVWSMHRDPQFFADPLKFDPERFSEQNRQNIKPFTYMPFGLGPRNCIGSRFALCEVKVMIYELLLRMQLSPGVKTRRQVQLSRDTFHVQMEGGHWVRFRERPKETNIGFAIARHENKGFGVFGDPRHESKGTSPSLFDNSSPNFGSSIGN